MIEATMIEATTVTTVQPGAGKTLADKLRDLKEAHDTGLIDDAEWAASKKMGRRRSASLTRARVAA